MKRENEVKIVAAAGAAAGAVATAAATAASALLHSFLFVPAHFFQSQRYFWWS